MGEAFAGHKVGKKAMIWGALAQSIPDIDFIAAFWQKTSANLLTHRGLTHSILFCIGATFVLTYFAEKWHRPHNISFARWTAFFGALILMHIFLDAFNNYGVGWFEPFSHKRISFDVIYVVDPFFSIIPVVALVMLIVLKTFNKKRRFWWRLGLGFCFLYLCYGIVNKIIVDHDVKRLLHKQQVQYNRYFTTPAPLQNWLWFVAAEADSGYYIGYRSVFDKTAKIKLRYFPRNGSLLRTATDQDAVKHLTLFSQGYYTAEKRQDTLIFNDLRFGQVLGWEHPNEAFAFHYYLQPDIDNKLVVQRGRFAKWDARSFRLFRQRIFGKELY